MKTRPSKGSVAAAVQSGNKVAPFPLVLPRVGDIHLHDTQVSVWEDNHEFTSMQEVFRRLVEHLRGRGFAMDRDPHTAKNYALIADWHYLGRKGDLEVNAKTSGRTAKVEFFQSLNIENPNGGRYDSKKLGRMPRAMRLQCIVEMANVISFLETLGYKVADKDLGPGPRLLAVLRQAEEKREANLTPLERYNARAWPDQRRAAWHTPEELGPSYNRTDRDGRLLCNGDVRYFYNWDRRLMRGVVYTNINGMWSVCAADGSSIGHVSCNELFWTDDPASLPQRQHRETRVSRVQRELTKATEAQNWKRVGVLARALEQTAKGDGGYYVLSLQYSKRGEPLTWWGPAASGYRWSLAEAGRYTEAEILAQPRYYDDGEVTIAVPCAAVQPLADAKQQVPFRCRPSFLAAAKKARAARKPLAQKAEAAQ